MKHQVCNKVTVSTLLYTYKHESVVTAVELKRLRKILGKLCLDEIGNYGIDSNQKAIENTKNKVIQKWFGYVLRMDNR